MMRASVLGLTVPLAACVAAAPAPRVPAPRADVAAELVAAGQGVLVRRTDGTAYGMSDGAMARRDADALCGAGGVRSSLYDRYQAGAWVFVGGCA